jgi:hypothetical protein
MNRTKFSPIRPMLIVFVVLTAFFISGHSFLERASINQDVVLWGNILIFLVSLVSFFLIQRSFQTAGGTAFLRGMYGSFMLKFFGLAIAAFIYIMVNKQQVSKGALGVCAGLYIIYTILEVAALRAALKKKADA